MINVYSRLNPSAVKLLRHFSLRNFSSRRELGACLLGTVLSVAATQNSFGNETRPLDKHPVFAKPAAPYTGASPERATELWDLVLLWYLEWIGQILDDTFAELDELESPEQWMGRIQALYNALGVPDELSPAEKVELEAHIDDTFAHLNTAPGSVSPAAITSFKSALASMKNELEQAPPPRGSGP